MKAYLEGGDIKKSFLLMFLKDDTLCNGQSIVVNLEYNSFSRDPIERIRIGILSFILSLTLSKTQL
jgi:hypothetical protein